MKRFWAVILSAAMLAGCRSSQPATNPFLRTTVPPPPTGQGMMVMPGEAATVPPVVTGGPPAVSPAVPVTPLPAPVIAPPPKQEEFHPPGGSYLYHQSSNDAGADSTDAAAPAELAVAQTTEPESLSIQPAATVQRAAYHDRIALSAGAGGQEPTLKFQKRAGGIRGDPPAGRTTLAADQTAAGGAVRMVGESVPDADTGAPAAGTVLRRQAGEAGREGSLSGRDAGGAGLSRIAIVAPETVSRPPAPANRPIAATAPTAFQQVATSEYAHAGDYSTLRGRLEYSQSSRQWKLRYIPIHGETDAYGGSVVLSEAASLKSYAPGDLVAVRGSLAAGSGSSGFSPRYQIQTIAPVAR